MSKKPRHEANEQVSSVESPRALGLRRQVQTLQPGSGGASAGCARTRGGGYFSVTFTTGGYA
jgi:hypothetical protein